MSKLTDTLLLPSGLKLKNRLVKSSTAEGFCFDNLEPNSMHLELYRLWCNSGAGLIITGNIHVNRFHREMLGSPALDRFSSIPQFKALSRTKVNSGAKLFVQLNHAGPQCPKYINKNPIAASKFRQPMFFFNYQNPKQLSETEIYLIAEEFVYSAQAVLKAGFDGVQIHSAHGYLLSSFLSSKTNTRTDSWGGSVLNRARLLMTIIQKIKEKCSANFTVAVKLNCSDFVKGGLNQFESSEVAYLCELSGADFIEVSGGNYYSMEMAGSSKLQKTYFYDYVKPIQSSTNIPIMITGGIRSSHQINELLNDEIDLIGMARPFCSTLNVLDTLLNEKKIELKLEKPTTGLTSYFSSSSRSRNIARLYRFQEQCVYMLILRDILFSKSNELKGGWDALRIVKKEEKQRMFNQLKIID